MGNSFDLRSTRYTFCLFCSPLLFVLCGTMLIYHSPHSLFPFNFLKIFCSICSIIAIPFRLSSSQSDLFTGINFMNGYNVIVKPISNTYSVFYFDDSKLIKFGSTSADSKSAPRKQHFIEPPVKFLRCMSISLSREFFEIKRRVIGFVPRSHFLKFQFGTSRNLSRIFSLKHEDTPRWNYIIIIK